MAGLYRKIEQIEEMQRHLAHSKAQLLGWIDTLQARPEGMSCDENAERVMTSFKH